MAWLLSWFSGTREKEKRKGKGKESAKESATENAQQRGNAGLKPRTYLKSKPRQARKSRTGKRHKAAPSRPSPYRAVTVHPGSNGCAAASRIKHQRFLATIAPQLPLGGCEHPQQCTCRYKHHTDRRVGLRRDSDHGLPEAAYHASNRRYRRDRRTHNH